jgi:hypothetical protein
MTCPNQPQMGTNHVVLPYGQFGYGCPPCCRGCWFARPYWTWPVQFDPYMPQGTWKVTCGDPHSGTGSVNTGCCDSTWKGETK